MTKAEFASPFERLCRGFKHDATPEQAEAWYKRIAHAFQADWSEAVTTLLCAPRFPYLDNVLNAIEEAGKHRRARALQCERKQAERLGDELATGGSLSPELFHAIKAFGTREQLRYYQGLVAADRRDWKPGEKERELSRIKHEEEARTSELAALLPKLSESDLAAFMVKYGDKVAA